MPVLGNLGTMFVRDKNGKLTAVPVMNGGYYTPELKDGLLHWTASVKEMPEIPPVEVDWGTGDLVYVLGSGETVEDAPDGAVVIYDPVREGAGGLGGGEGVGDLTDVYNRINAIAKELSDRFKNVVWTAEKTDGVYSKLPGEFLPDDVLKTSDVDTTLSKAGAAADAGAVGRKVEEIRKIISELDPVTEESIKGALGYMPANERKVFDVEHKLEEHVESAASKPVIINGYIYGNEIVCSGGYTTAEIDALAQSGEVFIIGAAEGVYDSVAVFAKYIPFMAAVGTLFTIDDDEGTIYSTGCVINLENGDDGRLVGSIVSSESGSSQKPLFLDGTVVGEQVVIDGYTTQQISEASFAREVRIVIDFGNAGILCARVMGETAIGALYVRDEIRGAYSSVDCIIEFEDQGNRAAGNVILAKSAAETDTELTEYGTAADAGAVGHVFNEVRREIAEVDGNYQSIPAWAKKPNKPVYTPSEVGSDAAGTASGMVSAHNTSGTAHNDIRLLISEISAQLKSLTESDDETLGKLQSLVAYIEENKSLIDSITVGKVNVSDIIDNLVTNAANKPLSANMGVRLKQMVDAIKVPTKVSELTNDSGYLTAHQDLSEYAKKTDLPTRTSQLANDTGYLTAHQDLSGYAKKTDIPATLPASDVYGWAKQAQKPNYTASEVGAASRSEFDALSAEVADYPVSVKRYGAVGDGTSDCTSAMQSALAQNRKVYIPGGTYKLSGELIIRDNCELVLAQDAVLNFTQSSGNCITLYRSASVVGNHATVNVVYAFTGKVINVDTTAHTSAMDVPPWTHWSPQWKTARYLRDLNICKPNEEGVHASDDGATNGTAVYICSNGNATAYFSWGTHFSGLKIAGAFDYGVRAMNIGKGYLNEMRIEALIDAPKIGVSLEDCDNTYISAAVQPRKAENDAVYAKHGIQLIRSSNTDLLGSRIWDWNSKNSLWTYDKDNVNQHFAMYGNCVGTIMNDFLYHQVPSGFNDIRELIYCDEEYKKVNFDSLVIIQEPVTKWFRSVGNEPYFSVGNTEERLLLKSEMDSLFQTEIVPAFTDLLASAIDTSGNVYNGVGYKMGGYWNTDGKTIVSSNYHTHTGYIRCKTGDVIHTKDISLAAGDSSCRIILYDNSFNRIMHINRDNIRSNGMPSYIDNYTETEDGFSVRIVRSNVAYITLSVYNTSVGAKPAISANEEIRYTHVGTMAEGVKVSEKSLVGMEKYEQTGKKVTVISAQSSDDQYPSAKAVYTALQSALGSYVNDIAALVGGDA